MNKKRYTLILLLAVIAGLLGGVISSSFTRLLPHHAKVIKAERFVVVDEDGQTRAKLALKHKTKPCLSLLDRDGQTRVELSVRWDGETALTFMDKDRRTRIQLALAEAEMGTSPRFSLRGKDGRASLNLRIGSRGEPILTLMDQGEEATAGLFFVAGRPVLTFQGGGFGTGLHLTSDGRMSLSVSGKEGNLTRLYLRPDGDVEPHLALTDREYKVLWAAP